MDDIYKCIYNYKYEHLCYSDKNAGLSYSIHNFYPCIILNKPDSEALATTMLPMLVTYLMTSFLTRTRPSLPPQPEIPANASHLSTGVWGRDDASSRFGGPKPGNSEDAVAELPNICSVGWAISCLWLREKHPTQVSLEWNVRPISDELLLESEPSLWPDVEVARAVVVWVQQLSTAVERLTLCRELLQSPELKLSSLTVSSLLNISPSLASLHLSLSSILTPFSFSSVPDEFLTVAISCSLLGLGSDFLRKVVFCVSFVGTS